MRFSSHFPFTLFCSLLFLTSFRKVPIRFVSFRFVSQSTVSQYYQPSKQRNTSGNSNSAILAGEKETITNQLCSRVERQKVCPVPDRNTDLQTLFQTQRGKKKIPCWAAHPRIAHIWENPPRLSGNRDMWWTTTLVTSTKSDESIYLSEAAIILEACKPCGSRACSGFALCRSVGESVTVAILLVLLYSIVFWTCWLESLLSAMDSPCAVCIAPVSGRFVSSVCYSSAWGFSHYGQAPHRLLRARKSGEPPNRPSKTTPRNWRGAPMQVATNWSRRWWQILPWPVPGSQMVEKKLRK